MADSGHSETARAFAPRGDDADDPLLPLRNSGDLAWHRRSISLPRDQSRPKWLHEAHTLQRRATRLWLHFTPLQRAAIVILNILLLSLFVLALVFHTRILRILGTAAQQWRDLPFGWAILWGLTFLVSFPPMIGYSMLVTIAGFVFGMRGWFIMSTATVIGSTCGFAASRSVLRGVVSRLTAKNKRFAALALVLKHDGLPLLIMIRLCPLPYSLSNGAISTIPTVTWPNFMIATAIASPKLLLHIFVSSKLGDLAEHGDKMDLQTRIVSYVSIIVGALAGITVGYIIYTRTKARAEQLEAEEAAAAAQGETGADYLDDPDEREAREVLRREDDISLHPTHEDEEARVDAPYSDNSRDQQETSPRDVFDVGDGEEDEGETGRKSLAS